MHVHRLPGEHLAPGCTMGRKQAGGSSVMLLGKFCWKTLGPGVHVDVTLTSTTYLSFVADHVHPFTEAVFPDGCGLFHVPCHKANIVQQWFENRIEFFKDIFFSFRIEEEHKIQFEVLTWPLNSRDLDPIAHLWDALVLLLSWS